MTSFPPDAPAPEWWAPHTDIYISEEGRFVVEVELAGIDKRGLELTVEAQRLSIRGERSDGGRRQRCQYVVKELRYGRFESVIEVTPDFDLTEARVSYRNGILQIDMPRKARGDRP